MRMQIIVGILVYLPGKGEHATGNFATFTGKAVRRRGVTFMSTLCHTSRGPRELKIEKMWPENSRI